jgi:hypothetical protein
VLTDLMTLASLDENPLCARTWASFRLGGDALRPDAVSAALELVPTFARAKDEEIPVGRVGKARRQRTGVWLLSSEHAVDSTSLEVHLIHLLDAVVPAAPALDAVRAEQDLRADFYCYWVSARGDGGPEISPTTLGRVAALNAALGIAFFDESDLTRRHSPAAV